MDFRAALVLLPVIFREKVDDYVTIRQVFNAKNLKQVGMHRNFDFRKLFSFIGLYVLNSESLNNLI